MLLFNTNRKEGFDRKIKMPNQFRGSAQMGLASDVKEAEKSYIRSAAASRAEISTPSVLGTVRPSGRAALSFSSASMSAWVKLLARMGLKGEPAREVRNCCVAHKLVNMKSERHDEDVREWVHTELAALSRAVKLAWTTSWWMPTPQTLELPAEEQWIYVAALTLRPVPIACSL
jgi:hypothetical protein